MRWSGAGAGLVLMAIVFVAVAMAMVVLFRIQPPVDRPPEACTPRIPLLQGPEIALSRFAFDTNDSAVLTVQAGARQLELRSVVITWRQDAVWRWDGTRTTEPGGAEVIRLNGEALRSQSCAVGDITVSYTLSRHGRVNATARELVQRVP